MIEDMLKKKTEQSLSFRRRSCGVIGATHNTVKLSVLVLRWSCRSFHLLELPVKL